MSLVKYNLQTTNTLKLTLPSSYFSNYPSLCYYNLKKKQKKPKIYNLTQKDPIKNIKNKNTEIEK